MRYHIRANSTRVSGALNLIWNVGLLRTLAAHLQDFVRRVVQRNAFWAHPEAVLLATMADSDAAVRVRAVSTIQLCRQKPHDGVRPLIQPAINFAATHNTELLEW